MADIDVRNFDSLRISLASPEDIRSWSRGEVKKPETINYRTLKPEKDGLFCEKIFGPTKDWECFCGKYKRVRFKGISCEVCGVEVTRSNVRRERMGHIELAAPVSHIWYFKGSPSRLGYLLEIPPKELEKVLYFASYIITSVDREAREEDANELRDELHADLDELDSERDLLVASIRKRTKGYKPDEDEIVDELEDYEILSEEEAEAQIADIYEEYVEHKETRQEAFDAFMKIEKSQLFPQEGLFRIMRTYYSDYFTGGMGAEAILELLKSLDLEEAAVHLHEVVSTEKGQKRVKAIKRLKVVDAFLNSDNSPKDMILEVLPVIPPELRPMIQLDGGRFATSDLNDLYRRVINRNNRLKRLLDADAPEMMVINEKRMLQEAVDSLIDNGRRGRPVVGKGNRDLKSLSDALKGKQGRFRQNLLGKRVDFSGRSVIVVGPQLKLHQCGLPSKMALELFRPFVIKRYVELGYAANIKAAKTAIDKQESQVWDVLDEVIKDHPVLLNRAPTLHRLSIQAFEPILVEGKAIRLHPLVCAAFNADFDGDQMAVHLPLSNEAQAEASVLMLSANNIKSPAHGRPLTVPSQDMVIGLYYLTAARDGFPGEGRIFIDFEDAENTYDARAELDLQAKIKVRLTKDTSVAVAEGEFVDHKAGERIETTVGRIIFNRILPEAHPFLNYSMDKGKISKLVQDCTDLYPMSTLPEILDGLKDAGFHYATRAGISVAVSDATVPPQKAEILEAADAQVAEIESHYDMGFLSREERHAKIIDIWNKANHDVGVAMEENFDKFNPIYMMAFSGARGNIKQIRQLAGMRGLMSDPKGEVIDRPIKANFREGLSVLEYFISTHGARKGLIDTSLRVADAGYLTRRLVDISQNVIVREIDCGTHESVEYSIYAKGGKDKVSGNLDSNLIGRCLARDVVDSKGKVLLSAGEYINSLSQVAKFKEKGVETLDLRTAMTCKSTSGICQKCYGWDLATSKPANIGVAVGIIAAQSIGEPGTQLTMRTFHTGGVAGEDITHGLPRVTELFEARMPSGQAVLSEIAGTLNVSTDKTTRTFTVHDAQGNIREYSVPVRAQLYPGVEDGCEVEIGQQLTVGSVYLQDLLRLTDANTTLRHIVGQVQDVYVSQGVDINDKHIEIIARQMLRRVTIIDAGDSDLLPGNQVTKLVYDDVVEDMLAQGKTPPHGQPLLLGLIKASLAADSFLSAASFQETTKVLTDAAIEGKIDNLEGLKERVITAKPIPAGTGLDRSRNVQITFKGVAVEETAGDELSDFAPEILREAEEIIPKESGNFLDGDGLSFAGGYASYYQGSGAKSAYNLSDEQARLYIYDDLGVSQRWANKFSEAGIETVADLCGYSEDDLMRIDGIGIKAIEELKAGLEEIDLLRIIEDDIMAPLDDMSQVYDIVFAPDDTVMIGGASPVGFNESEEMMGEALPNNQRPASQEEINRLLSSVGSMGFTMGGIGEIERKLSDTDSDDDSKFNSIDDLGDDIFN